VRRVVDHLLFLFLGPVPSFSAGLWLLGKFFGEMFDIDIYPLVSVIIFYFLKFPLINLQEQFLSFTTNPLSPFDYDPFNIPDIRSSYRVSLTNPSSINSSKQFQAFQVNSSSFYRGIYWQSPIWKIKPDFASFRYSFRVSRLHNFLLTGTLPRPRFTFDTPEYCAYFLRTSLFYRHFAV
jgi:hypothetical protein